MGKKTIKEKTFSKKKRKTLIQTHIYKTTYTHINIKIVHTRAHTHTHTCNTDKYIKLLLLLF